MRRGLGRGRTLMAIGAVLIIVAMPLPWLKVGGVVLPALTASGFEGAGVLPFLASVAMLALLVLPYTTRDSRSALDRPVAYLALLLVGLGGLGVEAISILGTEGTALLPTDVPGLWLASLGMLLVAWGVAELFAERPAAL